MCLLHVRRYTYPTEPKVIELSKLVPCTDNPNGSDTCINFQREVKTIPIGTPIITVRNSVSSPEQRMRDAQRDADAAFAKLGARGNKPPSLSFSSNATASPSMPSTPRSIPHSPTREKGTTSSRQGPRLEVPRPIISQPNPPAESSQNTRSSRTRWRLPSGVSARTRQHYSDSEYEFGLDPDTRTTTSTTSSSGTARADDRATEITDRGPAREQYRREERQRRREQDRREQERRERREREERALDEQELRTQGRMDDRERLRQEERARQRQRDARIEREQEERRQQEEQAARIRRDMEYDRFRQEELLRERQAEEQETRERNRAALEAEEQYLQRLQNTLNQRHREREQELERERERRRQRDIIAAADETTRRAEAEREDTQRRLREIDEIAIRLRALRIRDQQRRQRERTEDDLERHHRGHTRNSSSGSSTYTPWQYRYYDDGRLYNSSHYHLPYHPPPQRVLEGERNHLARDPFNQPWDISRPTSSRAMEDTEFRRLRGTEVLERARQRNAQAAEIPRVPLLSRRNTVQLSGEYRDRERRYVDTRRRYA